MNDAGWMRAGLDVLSPFGEILIDAEHDQIWFSCKGVNYSELLEPDYNDEVQYHDPEQPNYLDPSPVSADDAQRLRELGWFIDVTDGSGCWSHYC